MGDIAEHLRVFGMKLNRYGVPASALRAFVEVVMRRVQRVTLDCNIGEQQQCFVIT